MTSDRRTFLGASLLGASLGIATAVASRANGLTASARAESAARPSLSGDLSCDLSIRAEAAGDFGRLIHRQPRAVARPAFQCGYCQSATPGQEQRPRSTMCSRAMSLLTPATWKNVLDATLKQGLTPPVLTNYLGLSIGGTLAVGGIGGSSSRYGMQTDNVLELDVVTGDGKELTCSATSNPDIFAGVLAGLGQCAIITRATLGLVLAPERVRRFQLFYPSLSALTADQRRALTEQRFDQLQGAILPDPSGGWRYQLEGAVFYNQDRIPENEALLTGLSDIRNAAVISDLTYRDDALAFAKFENLLRSRGQWSTPKPWLLTFLRGNNAEQTAAEILAGLTNADVGPFGRITYYPILTNACRTPLLCLPDEEVVFPFNVIRIPTSNDAPAMQGMVEQNRALYDRIRSAGGIQYPVGAFPMSRSDWKDHFGSSWTRLAEAKRRHDPGNLLTPGYGIF